MERTTKGICATLRHIYPAKIGAGEQAAPSLSLADSKPDYLPHLLRHLRIRRLKVRTILQANDEYILKSDINDSETDISAKYSTKSIVTPMEWHHIG